MANKRNYKILLSITLFLFFSLQLSAQIPAGYYDLAVGKSGEELKEALNDIIKGHMEFPYTSSGIDTWDILKEADRDPDNPNNVLGIYSNFSMNGSEEFAGGSGWNREHVWPQSRGDFGTSPGPGTDCHHLRACDISTNADRSNRNFDECSTPHVDRSGGPTGSFTCSSSFAWKPRPEVVGDVARMIFYMATRYEGENGEPDLELTETLQGNTSKNPLHAKLSVLLEWHGQDPVSNAERARNEVIYGYQNNRNPFIDHPEFASEIWGESSLNPVIPEINFSFSERTINPMNQHDVELFADVAPNDDLTILIQNTNSGSLTYDEHFTTVPALTSDVMQLRWPAGKLSTSFSINLETAVLDLANPGSLEFQLNENASYTIGTNNQFLMTLRGNNTITSTVDADPHNFRIYPNPANNNLTIHWEHHLVNYVITDLAGKILKKGTTSDNLDISTLKPGNYLLSIFNGEEYIVRRIAIH